MAEFLKKAAIGTAAAVGIYTGAQIISDKLDLFDLPAIPDIFGDLADSQNHPPEVDASVLQDTYGIDRQFEVTCTATASVGVATHGNKDELMGGGEMDKIWYVDFDLCGEMGSVALNTDVRMDSQTGQPTAIVVETDGLQVHRPRLDALDYRNCVDLRVDDSSDEIEEKIQEWEERDPGDRECDNGFDISGLFTVGGDASKVINTAQAGAQIAALIDANPQAEVFDELQGDFLERLRSQIELAYPTMDPDNVEIRATTTEEQVQRSIDQAVEEIRGTSEDPNFYDIEVDGDDINVSAPGGGEVTVNVTSQERGDVIIEQMSEVVG